MAANGTHHIGYVTALLHDTGPDQHYCAVMPMGESAIQRLAHVIKAAREARGWTQPDLARESGVSRPTIQRYENGKIPSPEPDPVRRIFRALELDPREIPVILGLVTRDEMGIPPVIPAAPVRRFSATTEQIIELLEDPDVSNAEKQALYELLRARRRPTAGRDAGNTRKAG